MRIKSSLTQLVTRKSTIAFTFFALLIYSGNELWQVISWPPFYSLDEVLDIDYVYRVTQGQLPQFYDGVTFNPLNLDYAGAVQWKYQHPPLFYLMEAPILALFNAMGRPIAGIWAMRFFVYLLGCLAVICSAWAASQFLGPDSPAPSIVPLIIASNKCLQSVVFNYTLATLWIILLAGATAHIIRSMDISISFIAAWGILVALAPLIRTSLLPITFLCLIIITIDIVLNKSKKTKHFLQLVIFPATVGILDSSWFYIRLYRLSGNFTGSMPSWSTTHLGRKQRSFAEAFTDPTFWKDSFSQYHNFSSDATQYFGWPLVILLTFIPLITGIIVALLRIIHHNETNHNNNVRANMLIWLLLVGMLAGTSLQQVLYYKQGGSTNPVYFSMISIAFATFISVGLSTSTRLLPWTLSLWLGLRLCAFLLEVHNRWPASAPANGHAELGIYIAIFAVIIGSLWASTWTGIIRNREGIASPTNG